MNLIERDKQFVWHPFTQQKNMPQPIAITRGKGTLLFDENENAYIDAISSWWVNLHGHAHPYIAEKLYEQALQLEQVIFAGFTHKPAVELAEQLIAFLPDGFSKIFYSDNGSTSTEVALKMAVQYWWNKEEGNSKRTKILAFKNAYHGDTFGAMSVSDRSVFTLAFHNMLFEVVFIDTPTNENITSLQATIEEHGDTIAAFIFEPLVQGAGGLQMYEAALLDKLLVTAKAKEIICIADEVMTGFYRTGKPFAMNYMQQQADIICLSKGLTGGTMALGVTTCNKKIYEAYVSDNALQTFFHGHSFTANPLGCTAALASLHLLQQQECLQQVAFICEQNAAFAQILRAKSGVKNVRVCGTILAFEIDKGKDEYLNNIGMLITQKSLNMGVYLRPLGNTVYIMPPYCITKQELKKVYEVIEEIVKL